MEPPTKRARHGRAPRSLLPDDDPDEDEIAMDPEEFTMKQDPEYRLQKSRAVADNKLKSAFEKLFEKYGKDFGDTGDEINFYTDEIEVDNGHIASLPNAPKATVALVNGDGQDSNEDEDDDAERILQGKGGPAASNALVARPDSAWAVRGIEPQGLAGGPRLSNLVPSRFGMMGNGFSFGSPFGAFPGFGGFGGPSFFNSPVDAAWAVPDLPDSAFGHPGNQTALSYQPFRGGYSPVPKPAVVRRALPAALTNGDGDEDDDLILAISSETPTGTSTPLVKPLVKPLTSSINGGNSPKSPATSSGAAKPHSTRKQTHQSPQKSPKENGKPTDVRPRRKQRKQSNQERSLSDGEHSRRRRNRKGDSSKEALPRPQSAGEINLPRLVVEIIEMRPPPSATTALAQPTGTDGLPTPPVDSVPQQEEAEAGESSAKMSPSKNDDRDQKPKTTMDTVARNTFDPSYEFSDEEDGGLRKRKSPPKVKPSEQTPAKSDHPHPRTNALVPDKPRPARGRRKSTASPAKGSEPNQNVSVATPSKADQLPVKQLPVKAISPSTPQPKRVTAKLRPLPGGRSPLPGSAASQRTIPDSTQHSSIISLVSDDSDEDELSLGPDDVALANSLHRVRSEPSVRRRIFVPDGHYSSSRQKKTGGEHFVSSAAKKTPTRSRQATMYSSPLKNKQGLLLSGSPVQTPGGTIRRCGQDGFKCDRDFCFVCL